MKTKRLLAAFALASVVLFAGCKKDDYEEITGLCPIVVTTSPADGETSVPLSSVITATFNERMNPTTITQASFVIQGLAPVAGTITYSDSTATFTPSSPLITNTTYTGRITTAVKDVNGNALQKDYVWTFSTGSTITPMIVATDPLDGATNVVLNKVVTVTFNMPMNPASIDATSFMLEDAGVSVPGAITYSGSTAYYTPTSPLNSNTLYTATITNGAENMAGIAIPATYVWTFTTGTIVAPTVISTDPMNLAVNVPLNKVITATFSEVMNSATLDGASFTLTHGASSTLGIISYLGTTASFTPTSNLLSGTTYTATITTAAENPSGIPIANDYVWTFTTVDPLGPPPPDLNSVDSFGIIAGVGVSNNAGFSVIYDMNVGISPGFRSSITGFPPATVVNGDIYAADDIAPPGVAAMLILAKQDLTNAYLYAEGATNPAPAIVSGDIGGTVLAPGIYKSTSTLLIQSGDLTLDAQGDENAVWIFQVASAFTTVGGAGGNVILVNGAQAKNVYWQVGSSATVGDYTSFKGNILALTSVTMNSGAVAEGRMLCINGAVVMTNTNIITKP